MGEYVIDKNHLGTTGVSATSIKQIAVEAADSITGVKVNEKASSCHIYGNKIKINIIIKIDDGLDRVKVCQEVKDDVTLTLQNILEIRVFDLHVTASK